MSKPPIKMPTKAILVGFSALGLVAYMLYQGRPNPITEAQATAKVLGRISPKNDPSDPPMLALQEVHTSIIPFFGGRRGNRKYTGFTSYNGNGNHFSTGTVHLQIGTSQYVVNGLRSTYDREANLKYLHTPFSVSEATTCSKLRKKLLAHRLISNLPTAANLSQLQLSIDPRPHRVKVIIRSGSEWELQWVGRGNNFVDLSVSERNSKEHFGLTAEAHLEKILHLLAANPKTFRSEVAAYFMKHRLPVILNGDHPSTDRPGGFGIF